MRAAAAENRTDLSLMGSSDHNRGHCLSFSGFTKCRIMRIMANPAKQFAGSLY